MPTAQIKINTVAGSNTDLPINTVVNLSNNNTGGELTYAWTIMDQPAGPVDSLIGATTATPSFTPRKEGTYRIRLIVNAATSTEQIDYVVASVRQLLTRLRVPAFGETLEASTTRGWAESVGEFLQLADHDNAHNYSFVAVAANALVTGNIVKTQSITTIKTGLPGEEELQLVDKALASVPADMRGFLYIVTGSVDGSPIVANSLITVQINGVSGNYAGSPSVNDPVYVSDLGLPSLTPGTHLRQIGFVIEVSGGQYRFLYDGAASVNNAEPFLTNGAALTLPNSTNVQSISSTVVVKPSADATVPLAVQWFSAGQTADFLRFRNNAATVLSGVNKDGEFYCGDYTGGVGCVLSNDTILLGNDAILRGMLNDNSTFVELLSVSDTDRLLLGDVNLQGSIYNTATGNVHDFQVASTTSVNITGVGLQVIDGTSSNPAISFISEPGLGWYRVSANELALVRATQTWLSINTSTSIFAIGNLAGGAVELRSANGNLRLNNPNVGPVIFATTNTDRWQIDSGGVLSAVGGNRAISNVLDPVAAQDAATKNYIDTLNPVKQVVFAEITVDTTTTSATFATLISQAVTKQLAGTRFKITATWSASNSTNNSVNDFRVAVDGVSQRGASQTITPAGAGHSGAICVVVTGLSTGARTVTLEWRTSAGTARVRPVAAVDTEHASLVIEEIV